MTGSCGKKATTRERSFAGRDDTRRLQDQQQQHLHLPPPLPNTCPILRTADTDDTDDTLDTDDTMKRELTASNSSAQPVTCRPRSSECSDWDGKAM